MQGLLSLAVGRFPTLGAEDAGRVGCADQKGRAARAAIRPGRFAMLGLALGATAIGSGSAFASPITYHVDQTIGAGSVVGSIETDGTLGVVRQSNIIDWTLNLNGVGASFLLTKATSDLDASGFDLSATATALSFNYSGGDFGYLLFEHGLYGASHYYCSAAGTDVCSSGATVAPESVFALSAQKAPLSGNLVIGTAVSAVPLPSALPMFGAALLTLGGFGFARSRRKAGASAGSPA